MIIREYNYKYLICRFAFMVSLGFFQINNVSAAENPVRITVGNQPALPEDGCVYAGLGYSDRVLASVEAGIFQCRAQHWYLAPDATRGPGMSPADFSSMGAQADIAGDGCIYAGLGYSDGAVIQTATGSFLCKSHHWDHH